MLLHTSILCPLEIQVCDRSRSIYTLVIIFFANENIFGLIPLMCVCLFFATNYNSNAKIDDSVVPILLPAVTPTSESAMAGLLSRLDGILLTGSPSNVHPRHYHGTKATGPFDERRDEMTLPLLRATLASRVPLLAICRGLQELNVAYGGTLHHAVHELPDRIAHTVGDADTDPAIRFAPAHSVTCTPGGVLQRVLQGQSTVMVNTCHFQAIDTLAPGLMVEGRACDGTVEAVSVEGAKAFALGVQWHPEWEPVDNVDHRRIFDAFKSAARARMKSREHKFL